MHLAMSAFQGRESPCIDKPQILLREAILPLAVRSFIDHRGSPLSLQPWRFFISQTGGGV